MNLAIFDIDGTLTNTNAVDDECFARAFFEAYAITEIDDDWAAYPHTTDSGITVHIFRQRFGRSPEETEVEKFKNGFVEILTEQYRRDSSGFAEIAGASSALSRLQRDSEWAVAIATGSWRDSALLKLQAAKIDTAGLPAAYAEAGISREEILIAAVSHAVSHYRASSFEKIVSIGDGVWDLRTARRLNFAFLGVGRGESAERLQQAGAKHVIEDFLDYERLLRYLAEAITP